MYKLQSTKWADEPRQGDSWSDKGVEFDLYWKKIVVLFDNTAMQP
jgi:hypothetical protein